MNGWNHYIDNYCERLEPGFWAEPLNALSNLAFLIAAFVVGLSLKRRGAVEAHVLVAILAAIGVGSFLFHTFATRWAALADVIPIAAFILYFLYLANRHFLGFNALLSILVTLLFFPYAPIATYAIGALFPLIGSSAAYGSVALLIFIYAAMLLRRRPEAARDLALGGLMLVISTGFRIADEPFCDLFPSGTHMYWHIINAIMLAWMILLIQKTVDGRRNRSPASDDVAVG